jgi:hypothetical protein
LKNSLFLGVLTTSVALLGVAVLSAFLTLAFSEYRSARVTARQNNDSREAIDGLFIGAAIRFRMIYEVSAAGLLVHGLTLLAIVRKRRGWFLVTCLSLTGFSLLSVYLALVTRAPVLAAAAATSTVLLSLSVPALMRSSGSNS